MTTKQKILSKDIWVRTAETQPFFAFLSIIQKFSLGLLCKALHNKPCDHIDRTVHPAYNYTQANQKFKYWPKRQVLSLEKANDKELY